MAVDGSINFDTSVDNTGLISGLEDIRQIFDGINGTISGLVSGMTDFVRETALAHNEISNLGDAIQDSTRHMPTERFSFLRDIIFRLNPSMNRLADISGKAGNNFNGMKSALSGLGKIAGTIFSTKLLVDFGKAGIEAAAEINASNSQLEQTFGTLQTLAENAMKRIADSSGIVQTRLQNVGTSIYAFAKTAGMESSQALEMMEDALQVTADSAAYYDRSLEETSESLKSFLKGNFENDAALGLSCTETTRNITANKLYGKSFQELSEAQKQIALLQMVKDANELSGAMGQASREADGWENVIGNLKEAWKQFLAVVGQPVLQVAVSVVKQLTVWISNLTKYAESFVNAFSKVFGTERVEIGTENVKDEIAESVENQEQLTDAVEETAKANKKNLAGFDEINTISDKTEAQTNTEKTAVTESQDIEINPVLSKIPEITADTSPIELAVMESLNRLKSLIEPIKIAWDINKDDLITNAETAITNIKELFKSVGNSFADVWTNGTGEQYISNILILFGDILGIIGDIANALKEAWNDNGTGTALIQSYFDRWNALLELIHTIAEDFREVWNDGTGVDICTNIFEIITNVNRIVTNLRKSLKTAWEENDTGLKIIKNIFNIFNIILDTVNGITDSTKKWSARLDFSPLLTSIQGLLESLEPLTENIGEGLEWFYTNVLLPLAKWTIEDAVPSFIDLLSGSIDFLNAVIEVFKPFAKWLWDKFLQPIAQWTGGIIVTVIKNIADALKKISDWIIEHKTQVQDFIIILATIGSALAISGIIQNAVTAFTAIGGAMGLLNTIIAGLTPVITAFTGVWEFLTNPITLVCLAIAAVIAIGILLVRYWDEVKAFAVGMWESIQETMYAFFDWCVEKFNTVAEFLSEKWENIKSVFSVVGDWFKDIFTTAVENIIEVFKNIGSWFKDRWKDIKSALSDVGNWFKNMFKSAHENVKSVFKNIGNWFKERWNDITSVLSFVSSWFGDKFQSAYNNVTYVFKDIGSWFSDRWNDIIYVLSGVGDWFRNKFQSAYDGVTDIFDDIGSWFNDRWNDITSVLSIVNDWFRDKFRVAYDEITNIFINIGNWFKDRWNNVTSVLSGVSDWFRDKFQSAYDEITNIFSSLSGFFGGIWESIDEGARNGVNWVIDKINGLVDAAENAVNFIIDCINSLSFDIPAFVPGIGGSHFGFDISYVNIPDIPHLAKGTVIPANYGEFLAVLGDNRKEREFVTPESALKNAMLEVISQMNNSQGETIINVSMFPNERAFQQYIIKAGRSIQSRGGKIF